MAAVSSVNESGPWAKNLPGATETFAQSAANLRGVITDMLGGQSSAIADATVRLYSPDRILQTKSDRRGQFGFTNVPPGTYLLEATHQGFKTKKLGAIQVTEKSAGPYSITMEIATSDCGGPYSISYAGGIAGRTLRGVVLDDKQPLADAEVSLASAVGTRVVASRRSAGKGEFEFDKVEPGQYVLRVSHSGYRDELTEPFWVVRESGTEVVIQGLKLGLIRVCQ
jgi:hypothetical protein